MRFTPAAHACVAAGSKSLDARWADDARYAGVGPGTFVEGIDVDQRLSRLRVRAVVLFSSFGAAWAYFRSLGRELDLLPQEWCNSLGKSVTTASEAQAFFESLFRGRQSRGERAGNSSVRVFDIRVVDGDAALQCSHTALLAACAAPVSTRDRWLATWMAQSPEWRAWLRPGATTPAALAAAARSMHRWTGDAAHKAVAELIEGDESDALGLGAALPLSARTRERGVARAAAPSETRSSRSNSVQTAVRRVLLERPLLRHARLLSRVLGGWRRVVSRTERSACLLLTKYVAGDLCVLARRDGVAAEPPATAVWCLPGVAGLSRKWSDAVAALSRVVDVTCERADRVAPALSSARLLRATRRSFGSECTAVSLPMRGRPLSSSGDLWAWIPAADVARVCALPVATALAARDVLARVHVSPTVISASYGMPASQLGSRRAVTPSHLIPDVSRLPEPTSEVAIHSCVRSTPIRVCEAAKDEVIRVAMAEAASQEAPTGSSRRVDAQFMKDVLDGARRIAHSRGSSVVTPRDVATQAAAAAAAALPARAPRPSPAEAVPEHYDRMVADLRRVADLVARHREAGMPQPRVLIVGEKHGVLATVLAMAGADVATCDLDATDTPQFPHFRGDAKWIRDLGWDLVINHPPCVYLSNVGGMWLTREEGRVERVVDAASVYRQQRSAAAPFVVTENPKMHRLGRVLTQRRNVQYVQPWQHGTGHTKATGLEVTIDPSASEFAFDPLQPTCVVDGRKHAMLNLPQGPDRADQRARTYIGIAGAIGTQWLPKVVAYLAARHHGEVREPASQMVDRAGKLARADMVAVCFLSRQGYHTRVLGNGILNEIVVRDDESPGAALARWASESINLHSSWSTALKRSIARSPMGHGSQSVFDSDTQRHLHLWTVDIPSPAAHLAPSWPGGEVVPEWQHLSAAIEHWQKVPSAARARLLASSVQHVLSDGDGELERYVADMEPRSRASDSVVAPVVTKPATIPVGKLLFTRNGYVLTGLRQDGTEGSLTAIDCIGGKGEPHETVGQTVVREMLEEMPKIPIELYERVVQMVADRPKGHSTALLARPADRADHLVSTWCVPADGIEGSIHEWLQGGDLREKEWQPSSEAWRLPALLRRPPRGLPVEAVAARARERYCAGLIEAWIVASTPASCASLRGVMRVRWAMRAFARRHRRSCGDVGPRVVDWRPWELPRAPRKEWSPPVNTVKLIGRRWRAWQKQGTHDGSGGARFGWAALPQPLHHALSEHFADSTTVLPATPEHPPPVLRPTKGVTVEPSYSCAHVDMRHDDHVGLWRLIRAEWDRHVEFARAAEAARKAARGSRHPPAVTHYGLGFDGSTGRPSAMWDERCAKSRRAAVVADSYEVSFIRPEDDFLPSLEPPPADDSLPTLEPPQPARGDRKASLSWGASSPTTLEGASDVALCDVALQQRALEFGEDDIAQAPDPNAQYQRNCLYVRGLTVCRKVRRQLQRFRVDVAMTVRKSLADSGAGPSVLTTELLAALPDDACVNRDTDSEVPPTNGPDGKPLRTHGHATVIFDLGGVHYRHRFLVVEGAPLLILGNDFMDAYSANIQYGREGESRGVLTLQTRRRGQPHVHSLEVTVDPRAALTGSSVAAVQSSTGVSDTVASVATGGATVNPAVPPELPTAYEHLPGLDPPTQSADQLAKEHLEVGQSEYLVYSEQAIVVPARTKATVWLRAPLEFKGKRSHYLLEPVPFRAGVDSDIPPVQCRVVEPDADHRIPVTIWNNGRRALHVPGYSPVAQLSVEYDVMVSGPSDSAATYDTLTVKQKELVDSICVDCDAALPADQRRHGLNGQLTGEQLLRVRDMLARNIKAFAEDPKDPGHTHVMEVELPLKPGAVPHRHAASRTGEAGREIVEKHVAEMEARGIIRKSNSPWASRIVLVKKKGGEVRFCIDFRDCNSKLQYLDSPIPLTVEALDKLSSGDGDRSTLFLSTLDLASGFWCLPIKESDKGITAFTTGRAKYEFNYLPFGIQSGPSYMCRLMDAVLQGLAWEVCMPYLDDVGVWSTGSCSAHSRQERLDDSFEQMLKRLDLVFARLIGASLTCKASKCVLFATEAEYLGHIVSRDGLKMDPKKIDKVAAIEPESINTLERVRAFLGLCSYYRRFIPKFSKIAAPLSDLTQKGIDVERESQKPACLEAVRLLKEAITTEPVLAAPRFDRIFKVKTDGAQTEGIGGVLGQDDDEHRERVVAYYGRRLNKHERNYTVTEIELLAAIESIRNWRPYLWGRHFKLIIDHAALKWLHTLRDTIEGGPASRLMRWILKLSEYDFEVEHKAGVSHSDADGISRLVAYLETELRAQWARDCTASGHMVANVDGSGNAAPKKVRRQRKAVVTARRLQRKARAERNLYVSRESIIASYLDSGVLRGMAQCQADDEETSELRTFVQTGFPPAVTDRASLLRARWVARESRHLEMVGDVLVHVRPDSVGGAIFVPRSMREAILLSFHDHMGHPGTARMLELLRPRYYWPGMKHDVTQHVQQCHECTLSKPPPRHNQRSRCPEIGSFPFDLLYCDVVDMERTNDYDSEKKLGFSKAIVFADSLSRWVEVVPTHGDPTSSDVLDAFMTHVVSRHGVPRGIASDVGSNLASVLCRTIEEQTGVDLTYSPSDHHESAGLVERFIQTLTRMTRASDEGGQFWVDHLPFLLMSYRATPNRVTKLSPAELLYGRQLRLPAQIRDPSTSSTEDLPAEDHQLPQEVRDYAERLNARLRLAWEAARDAVHRAQVVNESDTTRPSIDVQFKVDDRVCRLLPPSNSGNKLQFIYSGPYRVSEVLSPGRYKLTDLENQMLTDTFDVSQLRLYRTHVDAEELQPDEFLVDELMAHRDDGARRTFQVKWRGYPRSQATWVSRAELMRRCDGMVLEYEARADATPPARPPRRARPRPNAPAVADDNDSSRPTPRSPNSYESDNVPTSARFARGRWEYGRYIATPRGRTLRWFQAAAFTRSELDNAHFRQLREAASAGQAGVAAVIQWELSGAW